MSTDPRPPWAVITALGLAQIISWGSFYYAFALLIPALSAHLRADSAAIVGAFSLALLVAGVLSAPVGHFIDRQGGRGLMSLGSLAGAALLALLSQVQTLTQFYLVWTGLGAVMAVTLYDPAFVVLARLYRQGARKAITMLTLFGGFASTVFWPLTQALTDGLGWQRALLVIAAINLLVALPLQRWALPAAVPLAVPAATGTAAPPVPAESLVTLLRQPLFIGLSAAFTLNTLVFSALSVHLIALLQAKQLTLAQAAWVGASIGPVQVVGRVLEYVFLGQMKPSQLGRIVICLLPTSLAALLLAQGMSPGLALFVLLYGMGNGMITIIRGALPIELYGAARYGLINGAMATPVLMAKAAGPLAAALLLAHFTPQLLLGVLAATGVVSALLFSWALARRG